MPDDIRIACQRVPTGWTCSGTIDDGVSSTDHTVGVDAQTLARLDPEATEPERLVRASFEFLLERESKQSILRTFGLTDIARYFPEWEREMLRRLEP